MRLFILSFVIHALVGLALVPDLPPAGAGAVGGWLLASAVVLPMGLRARAYATGRNADRLAAVGLFAMGLFSSLLVLSILRGVMLVVCGWLGLEPENLDRLSAQAVPLLAFALSIVGLLNTRRTAAVKNVDVPIPSLPAALDGFTIVQISDLHVGPTIRAPYIQRIVDRVNKLEPDAVAITGDLVDGTVAELGPHVAPLAGLRSRHGSYFVTGNHEYYAGAGPWVEEVRRLGIRVLQNEHVVFEREGARLVLAGVPDYTAHLFDATQRSDPAQALAGAPTGAVKVLLAHQPRTATAAEKAGFDLQISGHTHGGQFFPWIFFVRLQQPFTAGLHRLGRLLVYVSRGTGYWGPPKRIAAPSEITRLRFVPG